MSMKTCQNTTIIKIINHFNSTELQNMLTLMRESYGEDFLKSPYCFGDYANLPNSSPILQFPSMRHFWRPPSLSEFTRVNTLRLEGLNFIFSYQLFIAQFSILIFESILDN